MTVGELKKQLENIPDDLQVITSICDDGGGWDYFTDLVGVWKGNYEQDDFVEEGNFNDFKKDTGIELKVNCILIGQ